jgi:hypothetical protein
MVEVERASAASIAAKSTGASRLGDEQVLDLAPPPSNRIGPATKAAPTASSVQAERGLAMDRAGALALPGRIARQPLRSTGPTLGPQPKPAQVPLDRDHGHAERFRQRALAIARLDACCELRAGPDRSAWPRTSAVPAPLTRDASRPFRLLRHPCRAGRRSPPATVLRPVVARAGHDPCRYAARPVGRKHAYPPCVTTGRRWCPRGRRRGRSRGACGGFGPRSGGRARG